MIALIDYGAGNLQSVSNALDDIGARHLITNSVEEINSAEKIIFPGVGEAASAMKKLKEYNIIDAIKKTSKPLLGICLGMQLLCEFSEERNVQCLNIIDSTVTQFDKSLAKVPHMGWNKVFNYSKSKLFEGISNGSYFYYANSFFVPISKSTIATTEYCVEFSAAINKDNFYGVQFHPEKSGIAGLRVLKNFLELC